MENAEESTSGIFEGFHTKERSVNFSKEEIHRLQVLVDKYKKILMCKKTDGISSKQKEHAWKIIEKEFNAVGQTPRKLKQLKYKFENMKRCAKKAASMERQEMRRTGGGKPPTLPPDTENATDWLRSIMSGSIDGNTAVYDDDVITPNSVPTPISDKNDIILIYPDANEIPSLQKETETNESHSHTILDSIIPEENLGNNFDCSTPHSSLKKPIAPPLKRLLKKKNSDNIIKRTLREKKISILDELHDIELEKIRQSIIQQMELHEQKIKQNEEKHNLELIKLKLEIDILEIEKANKKS